MAMFLNKAGRWEWTIFKRTSLARHGRAWVKPVGLVTHARAFTQPLTPTSAPACASVFQSLRHLSGAFPV